MPSSARADADFSSFLTRAHGSELIGIIFSSSPAVPVQVEEMVTNWRTASTTGSGGGAGRAAKRSSAVQWRAGAEGDAGGGGLAGLAEGDAGAGGDAAEGDGDLGSQVVHVVEGEDPVGAREADEFAGGERHGSEGSGGGIDQGAEDAGGVGLSA